MLTVNFVPDERKPSDRISSQPISDNFISMRKGHSSLIKIERERRKRLIDHNASYAHALPPVIASQTANHAEGKDKQKYVTSWESRLWLFMRKAINDNWLSWVILFGFHSSFLLSCTTSRLAIVHATWQFLFVLLLIFRFIFQVVVCKHFNIPLLRAAAATVFLARKTAQDSYVWIGLLHSHTHTIIICRENNKRKTHGITHSSSQWSQIHLMSLPCEWMWKVTSSKWFRLLQ